MKMKIRFDFRVVMLGAVLLMGANAFGLGSDYSTNNVAQLASWPKGVAELVNSTNRVHGFFVNENDLFFFQGGTNELNLFLQAYSRIEGIERHELVLHEGVGDAKSPWEKDPRVCDWSISGYPKSWAKIHELSAQGTNSVETLRAASKVTGYILTVNFWTGGKIAFDQIKIPENVKVVSDGKTQ
jgi:hypothetical protein